MIFLEHMQDINPQETMVLAIAGSDPSGGAGIQADLKTFTSLGVYGGAVITCLTAQNTTGVYSYYPIDAEIVQRQIELVLLDMQVSHIKIGMVGSSEIALIIHKALADFEGEVIYDPVLMASTGQPLVDPAALDVLSQTVMGCSSVMTPNLPELIKLTGRNVESAAEIREAALFLFNQHKKLRSIIVKGGHGDPRKNTVTDYLVLRDESTGEYKRTSVKIISESHPRIKTDNDHGTGCTFASAFTAFHMGFNDDETAFKKAAGYMVELLSASESIKLGGGRGPLMHHLVARRKNNVG